MAVVNGSQVVFTGGGASAWSALTRVSQVGIPSVYRVALEITL